VLPGAGSLQASLEALGIRWVVTSAVMRSHRWVPYQIDPLPVSIPVLMREMGNSPRGVSEGGAQPRP
jgi:hypothetical protein